MELVLRKTTQAQVAVVCDGQPSHTFNLPDLPSDPVEIGQRLFAALFRAGTPVHAAWDARPKHILLVAEDPSLDAIPWEYLRGPDGFIALDVALVRGLPPAKRQPSPDLTNVPLHVVAIPSNPVDHEIARLDIEGEWTRLKESLTSLQSAITLERVRPPTLEQARRLTANQRQRVIHFMGHGGKNGADSFLLFENDFGAPKAVTAQEFIRRLEDAAFLVTLNACVSAAPGETQFSNVARALAERGAPYALGMRFPIPDADAKSFSRTFYDELACGASVENALRQARNSLADSRNIWAVGTPVLYTSLQDAAPGFAAPTGTPRILERQPPLELFTLPRAEGTFQGRVDELLALGQSLTGEPRAKLLTIHGAGGQGKTTLAREAAERFAHAWPGGVWAVSLEDFYVLDRFTLELGRLFKIDLDGIHKQIAASYPNLEIADHQQHFQEELERRILAILTNRRILLVLDNAETFIEAVDAKNAAAIDLAVFLREKVLSTQTGLLVTSREHLAWSGEQLLELDGLSPDEGARLFWQSAPRRGKEAIGPQAQEISHKVAGHPLSLRLLGSAFDASGISLDEFVQQVEFALLHAKDKYKREDHRHSTLFAVVDTSVRYMDETHQRLLSCLWLFQAPFQPEAVAAIVISPDLPEAQTKAPQEQVYEQLHTLYQRGLLVQERETLTDGSLLLYRSQPIVRLFAQNYLEQAYAAETLRARMGNAYYNLLLDIRYALERNRYASYLAGRCREDLEVCIQWVEPAQAGWYADHLGWVLQWIGDRGAGLRWLERALETAEGIDADLALHVVNNLALVHRATGRMGRALELFERALSVARAASNRTAEATTLNNIAMVYSDIGQPGRALELYEQALSLHRQVGDDRVDEAATIHNIASVYADTGYPERALELYEQALSIRREVSDRAGEAATLNNLASLYNETGQPGRALELYDQALALMREVGDRAGEVAALANSALVYSDIGYPARALELYKQVLPLQRTVGDRAGEATTLNNMAGVYRNTGELDKALELYQQALSLIREMGDRMGEARTLNNLGMTYSLIDQAGRALELYTQALTIRREVGDRAGEAKTINNLGMLHAAAGQPDQALELYTQALPLMRAVGDRAGEAATLNNLANVYTDTGQPERALDFFEQALSLMRAAGDRLGEATALMNMATLCYADLSHPQEAIDLMEGAISILQDLGLSQNASGITIPQLQSVLEMMKNGKTLA